MFKVDNPLASSSFFVRNLNVAAAAARALGLEPDAVKYEELSKTISVAFVKRWWNALTQRFETAHGLQSSVALPLFTGICGASNISVSCARALAEITIQGECLASHYHAPSSTCFHAMHVTGGILGAEALLPALSMAGRGDIAIAVALQTDFPSWAAMAGSGTLWEKWDGDLSDPEGSSRNHVMFSSIRTWAGVAVGGLSALVPGWSSVLIAPDWRIVHSHSGSINASSCSVFSPAGAISTSWSVSPPTAPRSETGDKIVRVTASLPPTVSGIVCVPCLDCSTATISESGATVWNGSSGFVAGVEGVLSASLQRPRFLVKWTLAYPGSGVPVDNGEIDAPSTCFEVDSGDYLFVSN